MNRSIGVFRALALTLSVAVAGATAATAATMAIPSPAMASSPSASAPMTVRFQAGPHTGYRFDSTGQVTASKTASLSRASSASTTRRATIRGRGVHLLISTGTWAGYYVPESIAAYMPGYAADRTYDPSTSISFPAGTVLGYRYDASWQMTSVASIRLTAPSSASADQFAVINGIRSYRMVNGGLAGRWVPAAAAGAALPLSCRTGARATGDAQVLSRVGGAGREVALTFDLGGRTEPALSIVKRLLRYGVCATIFPTGDAASTAAGERVLRFIGRYPQVFEVGNHTQDHCDLVNGGGDTGCPSTRQAGSFTRSQLNLAAVPIAELTGQSPKPYWRPPYGSHDAGIRSAAAAAGYTKTVMWDIDTIDWLHAADGGPSTARIVTKVRDESQNGSIVLMHLGGWNTLDALPGMVNGLRVRGMSPTTISDLVDGT